MLLQRLSKVYKNIQSFKFNYLSYYSLKCHRLPLVSSRTQPSRWSWKSSERELKISRKSVFAPPRPTFTSFHTIFVFGFFLCSYLSFYIQNFEFISTFLSRASWSPCMESLHLQNVTNLLFTTTTTTTAIAPSPNNLALLDCQSVRVWVCLLPFEKKRCTRTIINKEVISL